MMTDWTTYNLAGLAAAIRADWKKVYFGAVPYLDAMSALDNVEQTYGADDARGIVAYFLANANGWRGETARAVKAELKRRVKS